MTNDKDNYQQDETLHAGDPGRNPKEQFNELSELSLEERMAVADRIGIPVDSVSEAVATGTMSGPDDRSDHQNEQLVETDTDE